MKIIKPGFLSRSYDVYGISSPLVKKLVYRRVGDFACLRENLTRLYPGYAVPTLPRHHLKRLETEYVTARKEELQFFLNRVVEHPLLRTSMLVWDFLTVESEKEYDAAKANTLKIPSPKNVSEYITIKGTVNVDFNRALNRACNNIDSGIKKTIYEFSKYFSTNA